ALLESRPILDSLISKYDLYKVYNIPKDRPDLMYGALGDNIDVEAEDTGPISISVYDTDRKRAADMANDIIVFTNELSRYLNRMEPEPISRNILQRLTEVRAQQDSLSIKAKTFLTKNNVIDAETQGSVIAEGIAQAEAAVSAQRAIVDAYTSSLGADDPR